MDPPVGSMAGADAMQQTMSLVVQILQRQQQQAVRQMVVGKQQMRQQVMIQRNLVDFLLLKMTLEDDPETVLESFKEQ